MVRKGNTVPAVGSRAKIGFTMKDLMKDHPEVTGARVKGLDKRGRLDKKTSNKRKGDEKGEGKGNSKRRKLEEREGRSEDEAVRAPSREWLEEIVQGGIDARESRHNEDDDDRSESSAQSTSQSDYDAGNETVSEEDEPKAKPARRSVKFVVKGGQGKRPKKKTEDHDEEDHGRKGRKEAGRVGTSKNTKLKRREVPADYYDEGGDDDEDEGDDVGDRGGEESDDEVDDEEEEGLPAKKRGRGTMGRGDTKKKVGGKILAKVKAAVKANLLSPTEAVSDHRPLGVIVTELEKVVETQLLHSSRRPANVMCRVEGFLKAVEKLDDSRKIVVRQMGFGHLLNLKVFRLDRKFCYWLVTRLDPDTEVMRFGDGKELPLTPYQWNCVFGIPSGGYPVPFSVEGDDFGAKERGKYVGYYFGVVGENGKSYISFSKAEDAMTLRMGKKKGKLQSEEEVHHFRTAFLMLALGYILCPSTDGQNLALSLVQPLTVACDAEAHDWCEFCFAWTMAQERKSVDKFKDCGYFSGGGGCILFFLIFYLDHLNLNPISWHVTPRVDVWKQDDVSRLIRLHRKPGGDYGKIGALDVAYGQRHPRVARDRRVRPDLICVPSEDEIVRRVLRNLNPRLKAIEKLLDRLVELVGLRDKEKGDVSGEKKLDQHGEADFFIIDREKGEVLSQGMSQMLDVPAVDGRPTPAAALASVELATCSWQDVLTVAARSVEHPAAAGEGLEEAVDVTGGENVSVPNLEKIVEQRAEVSGKFCLEEAGPGIVCGVGSAPNMQGHVVAGVIGSENPRGANEVVASNPEMIPAGEVLQEQVGDGMDRERTPEKENVLDGERSPDPETTPEEQKDRTPDRTPEKKGPKKSSFGTPKGGGAARSSGKRVLEKVVIAKKTRSYGNVQRKVLNIVSTWTPRRTNLGNVPLIESEGCYATVADCSGLLLLRERVSNAYIRVAASMYTREWAHSYAGHSRRIMLTPTFSDRITNDTETKDDAARKYCGALRHLNVDDVGVLFVPVVRDDHCWCLVFDLKEKALYYIDTMYEDPAISHKAEVEKLVNAVDVMLAALEGAWVKGLIKGWPSHVIKILEPVDNNCCGVIMLWAIKYCADRFMKNFGVEELKFAREALLYDDLHSDYNDLKPRFEEIIDNCNQDKQDTEGGVVEH